jgi:hypothetical protein
VTPEYVVVIESVGHVHSALLNMGVLFLPKIEILFANFHSLLFLIMAIKKLSQFHYVLIPIVTRILVLSILYFQVWVSFGLFF